MAFEHLSRAERRTVAAAIDATNKAQPDAMTIVPRETWPLDPRVQAGNPPTQVWRSRHFLAQLFVEIGDPSTIHSTGVRLSINRTSVNASGRWRDDISWDELMRVKRECGFADRWAVEVYPPDDEIVNVANMRHLWLLPEPPSYGWKNGRR